MIQSLSKRGRPAGSSQFPEDRVALERMHEDVLCERGMTAYKAAEKVVDEMGLAEPKRSQTLDRLRKKYPKFCEVKLAAAKKAEALRSVHPTPQPGRGLSPQDCARIRECHEYLETPAGRPAKEIMLRFSRGDETLLNQIRQAEEGARLWRKVTG